MRGVKEAMKRLDMSILSVDSMINGMKKQGFKKQDEKGIKSLYKRSFLSFPEDDKGGKQVRELLKNIDFVSSIRGVNVKYVRGLVSVRKDRPIMLKYEDLFEKTEEPNKWDVLGLIVVKKMKKNLVDKYYGKNRKKRGKEERREY
ncbi:hypothetical protein T552_03502 [Pneumocystis carinii B80]|uniref:Uncharacterized protein n=1 Tax=Pneumocystis carinii (strain B80) TaxID=1408658 RepID=A0A0W4ZB36_PNEC8|nr:hypothetical protein T552_03502 [Pneumocystis carinii B80]KTW25642.1 hypothetical protein T552_03502 [Pneumocystis carinii B80]